MRIYLDNCSLQRPLDDRSQLRIRLEAEAILAILALCADGEVEIVSSEVLQIEIAKNPYPQRKAYASEILKWASLVIEVDESIVQRAKSLEYLGFKGMDALHIAAAEAEHVDYFCSCDDRLINRTKRVTDIEVKVVTPLELVEEII
jgi:predicted nucleic acid-binding protein